MIQFAPILGAKTANTHKCRGGSGTMSASTSGSHDMFRSKYILFLSAILLSSGCLAQSEGDEDASAAAPAPQERHPCKTDENHRAFDFWVGTWDVKVNDEQAGVNEIKLILGDCVLFENWTGGGDFMGKSFNYYDASKGHWRQIWVDDRGGVIEFTGEIKDGAMYYTATTNSRTDGTETQHQLNFIPQEDGSVQQIWHQSSDGGETWNTVWDSLYVKQ
jgi:hypothetical protein